MKTRNKILYILVCLIIIAGIVTWKNNGFNLELQYSTRDQINISNNTSIKKEDIEQITKEVLGDTRYFIQEVKMFGNSISIVADKITDEQKNQIVEKFNEKYETDIEAEDIETVAIPFTRVKDVIKPYILPGITTLAIIVVYALIRFKTLGWKNILSKLVIIPVLAELLLYSIIARIPFGRVTIACGIGLYVIIIAILTNKFENEKEKGKAEQLEAERK